MKRKLMAMLVSIALLATVLVPSFSTFATELETTPAPVSEPAPAPVEALASEPEPAKEEPKEVKEEAQETKAAETETLAEEPASTEQATDEPTEKPAENPISEETKEPVAETTDDVSETNEPTAEPTESADLDAEPTVEPTAEPSIEPSVEPSVEPTVEPEALSVGKSNVSRYAFANEGEISMDVEVSGGVAPYSLKITVNGEEINTIELAEAGKYTVSYAPTEFGKYTLAAEITDANGETASVSAEIPVTVREKEKKSKWEKTFKDVELTGDWREDLIAIAKTQLGYEESSRNFIIDEDGEKKGYTRYGDWYGSDYENWCAMFITFCLRYAGIEKSDFPGDGGCDGWKDKLQSRGAYEKAKGYEPQRGDLIFFDWDDDGELDHVGIVERVSGSTVHTIEGNSASMVRRQEYDMDDETIDGYANTTKLMEKAGVLEELEPEPTAEPTAEPSVEPTAEPTINPDDMPIIEDEKKTCECFDEEGNRACDESCTCDCHNEAQEPETTEEPIATDEPIAPTLEFKQWEQGQAETSLSYEVADAIGYVWQSGAKDENGEMVWTDIVGSNSAMFLLPVDLNSLKLAYRCVAIKAGNELEISDSVTLIDEELVDWLNAGEVTDEMLFRAMNTRSLESLTIEDGKLIYVRTGKSIANYDSETGALRESEFGVVVAYVDMETKKIVPLTGMQEAEPAEEQAEASVEQLTEQPSDDAEAA